MGLSQRELAEELAVSKSAVSGWETGRHNPKVEDLRELGRMAGVSVSWLVGDTDQRTLTGNPVSPTFQTLKLVS